MIYIFFLHSSFSVQFTRMIEKRYKVTSFSYDIYWYFMVLVVTSCWNNSFVTTLLYGVFMCVVYVHLYCFYVFVFIFCLKVSFCNSYGLYFEGWIANKYRSAIFKNKLFVCIISFYNVNKWSWNFFNDS